MTTLKVATAMLLALTAATPAYARSDLYAHDLQNQQLQGYQSDRADLLENVEILGAADACHVFAYDGRSGNIMIMFENELTQKYWQVVDQPMAVELDKMVHASVLAGKAKGQQSCAFFHDNPDLVAYLRTLLF